MHNTFCIFVKYLNDEVKLILHFSGPAFSYSGNLVPHFTGVLFGILFGPSFVLHFPVPAFSVDPNKDVYFLKEAAKCSSFVC